MLVLLSLYIIDSITVTLLFHCCCITVPLLLHYCFIAVALLLHYCCITVPLLFNVVGQLQAVGVWVVLLAQRKASFIKRTTDVLDTVYAGDIPSTLEGLVSDLEVG